MFSVHAWFARPTDLVSSCDAFDDLSSMSRSRVSVMPILSSITIALSEPEDSPCTNRMNVPAASCPKAVLNSLALMPATLAKAFRSSFPVSAATFMAISALEKAVPPACASRPSEASPPEMPKICWSVMPAWLPAAPMACAKATIFDSVVARLFPSSTVTDPSRAMLSCGMPVMFAYCANDEAAASAVRSVVSARSAIVRVKPTTFSVAMPSCPAFAAMSASSSKSVGTCMPSSASSMPCRSSSVPLMVLRTPAKLLSHAMAASEAA